jgi:hypothetical protein
MALTPEVGPDVGANAGRLPLSTAVTRPDWIGVHNSYPSHTASSNGIIVLVLVLPILGLRIKSLLKCLLSDFSGSREVHTIPRQDCTKALRFTEGSGLLTEVRDHQLRSFHPICCSAAFARLLPKKRLSIVFSPWLVTTLL